MHHGVALGLQQGLHGSVSFLLGIVGNPGSLEKQFVVILWDAPGQGKPSIMKCNGSKDLVVCLQMFGYTSNIEVVGVLKNRYEDTVEGWERTSKGGKRGLCHTANIPPWRLTHDSVRTDEGSRLHAVHF